MACTHFAVSSLAELNFAVSLYGDRSEKNLDYVMSDIQRALGMVP